MSDAVDRLSTEEVARRLGVKRETVYAYVSRGLLERHPASHPHESRFDPEEVDRLAARARRPDRSSALEVVVETELTLLDPAGRLSYRGRDAVELARYRSFEEVMALLWDGAPATPWRLDDEVAAKVDALVELLGPDAPDAERIAAVVATLAACDPAREDRHPESVRRAGAAVFAASLAALTSPTPALAPDPGRPTVPAEERGRPKQPSPDSGRPKSPMAPLRSTAPDGAPVRSTAPGEVPEGTTGGGAAARRSTTDLAGSGSVAGRLWVALADGAAKPRPEQVAALNAALILLADHELAASTFAARVAASAWAGPYRVILAGLGPLGGALHGGAGLAVEALIDQVASGTDPGTALDAELAAGPVPGFGHRVYRDRDPRADHLLDRLLPARTGRGRPTVRQRDRGRPGVGKADQRTTARGEADERSTASGALAEDGGSTAPRDLEAARALLDAAAERGMQPPNVDFALATLVRGYGLRDGSAATIFTFARIAGIVAHALEEYEHRLRFRPRASYVGPAPPASAP